MSELRIYTSGGVLQYDSTRPDASYDERNDRLKQLFSRGVFMYYDPGETFVRCAFKANTPQPRQFYAEYSADFDNTLAEFKSQLDETVQELGWSMEESDTDSLQYFYANLTDETVQEPPYEGEVLANLIREGRTLDFGTPDKQSAIELFHFFRQRTNDSVSMAISENGRGAQLGDDVSIVITPGATSDEIDAIGKTKRRIANYSVDSDIERVRKALEKTTSSSSGAEVAGTLNKSGLLGRGLEAITRGKLAHQRRSRRLLATVLVAPLFALAGFVLSGNLSVLVERILGLGQTFVFETHSTLPGPNPSLPLLVAYVFIVLVLGGTAFVLSRLWGAGRRRGSTMGQIWAAATVGRGRAGTRSQEVKTQLEQFASNQYVTREAIKNRLPRVAPDSVEIRGRSELNSLKRRHYLVGAGIGAGLGGMLGIVAGVGLNVLLDNWKGITLVLLNLSLAIVTFISMATILLFLVVTVRIVTPSRSQSRNRRRGHSSRRGLYLLLLIVVFVVIVTIAVVGVTTDLLQF